MTSPRTQQHGSRDRARRRRLRRCDRAVQAADAAARAAGVVGARARRPRRARGRGRPVRTIWGRDGQPADHPRAAAGLQQGGQLRRRRLRRRRLVGASVGFFHAPAEDALHSHIAGVVAGRAGRSVGFALKLHQRAWALLAASASSPGPSTRSSAATPTSTSASWAPPAEYLPNFYGMMRDGINGGDETDRLLVRWQLRDAAVVAACAGRSAPAQSPTSSPGPRSGSASAPTARRCPAPRRATVAGRRALRHRGPPRRRPGAGRTRWRVAVREVLAALLADGGRIVGFDRAGLVRHRGGTR